MKTIDINEKQNINYCISTDLRDEQIKINIKKVKARFEPSDTLRNEPIAIVCYGVSLKDTWEQIKNFKYIMTCSGAHKFLIDNGIVPTWHVDLEPREHKIKMLGEPHKDVEYLIASTVHPKYLDQLEGFNVKLWHIFSHDEDRPVLPRGEWWVTGGSSVGLRCMTLARLIGFTDLHIFGMDGNVRTDGSHGAYHPNAPKEYFETEYNGKKYLTTPSILHCAKETFKELDQMPDVVAKFYGNNLVADMAKDYKPSPRRPHDIAFNKPQLISEEYIELNRKLHQDNPQYGMSGSRHKDVVLKMADHPDIKSILDYGCGKGMLGKSIPFPIWEYDPAVPGKDIAPKPADLVVCTDVLEHIEPDKLNFVLEDLKRVTKQIGYFVIATRPAIKTYANGQNTHLIIQKREWWEKQLNRYFDIAKTVEGKEEIQVIVSPKTIKQPEHVVMEKGEHKFKYLTPNDTTKWRANSLFKKEPATIEWLDSIPAAAVIWDIGANVGTYTIYAGIRGAKVYAFEPEAENFAILTKNMIFNGLEPTAYNIALSDKQSLGTLYLGNPEAGGACHSFGAEVGHDLRERPSSSKQGCVSLTIDQAVYLGLPFPEYIKIDVDGFEEKVILGACETFRDPRLKSVIIEVNPSLPEHKRMLEAMRSFGFQFDPEQVEKAERKEGIFKGVAEHVFTRIPDYIGNSCPMTSCNTVMDHDWANSAHWTSIKQAEPSRISASVTVDLAYKVNNAAIELEPFNHLYIEDIIPADKYYELTKYIDEAEYIEIEKSRGTKGYPLRYTAQAPHFLKDIFLDGKFKKALLDKFSIKDDGFVEDLLLVRDLPGYKIPPHTDSTRKVITVLIYLPDMEMNEGTSIYIPKQKGFSCKIGKHYSFEDFEKIKTMPFRPNSGFIFARTDKSFHGVEPSRQVRDVLLYNINRK